ENMALPVLASGAFGWGTLVATQVMLEALRDVRVSAQMQVDLVFPRPGVGGVVPASQQIVDLVGNARLNNNTARTTPQQESQPQPQQESQQPQQESQPQPRSGQGSDSSVEVWDLAEASWMWDEGEVPDGTSGVDGGGGPPKVTWLTNRYVARLVGGGLDAETLARVAGDDVALRDVVTRLNEVVDEHGGTSGYRSTVF